MRTVLEKKFVIWIFYHGDVADGASGLKTCHRFARILKLRQSENRESIPITFIQTLLKHHWKFCAPQVMSRQWSGYFTLVRLQISIRSTCGSNYLQLSTAHVCTHRTILTIVRIEIKRNVYNEERYRHVFEDTVFCFGLLWLDRARQHSHWSKRHDTHKVTPNLCVCCVLQLRRFDMSCTLVCSSIAFDVNRIISFNSYHSTQSHHKKISRTQR